MYLLTQAKGFKKSYLVNTSKFHYKSIYKLIYEIFSKHHFVNREAELYLLDLLRESGYSTIDDIPTNHLEAILEHFNNNKDKFNIDYDEEKLTYLLLYSIQSRQLILIIDNQTINDLSQEISLQADSIISFVKVEKINTINFKSI